MKTKKIEFKPFSCQTGGNGLWSSKEKKVNIIKIAPVSVTKDFVSFDAYFDKKNWNPDKDGLIYTDERWIREFREELVKLGVTKKVAKSIDYTEQGMQGDDYVSLETDNIKFAEYMGWS